MERADKYINDIELLFQEWKNKAPSDDINHSQNVFIRDGIVCPEQWFSQKVRPLYLLKEAYHGTSDWDLIKEHLLTEAKMGKHITWKRVSQWTQGLLHTSAPIYARLEMKWLCTILEMSSSARLPLSM